MERPLLLPTCAGQDTTAGITYYLDGNIVPSLTVNVTPGTSVYFEHHTLLWKTSDIAIDIKPMSGGFKRMLAGMPVILTEATGAGHIAFSRDKPGHVFPLHLERGQRLDIREHQFLAATSDIDFTFQLMNGASNVLFGRNSFFIDTFSATTASGIVWLYGYGNVFEIALGPSDQIDVKPGAWIYKDPSVGMETNLTGLSTGIFAGSSLFMNRFTGPGRLGLQSMSLPIAPIEGDHGNDAAGWVSLALQALGKG